MNAAARFAAAAAAKAGDDAHRQVIRKAVATYQAAVAGMQAEQFRDWGAARRHAAAVKDYVLAHLPELLEAFAGRLTARGAVVHWAADAAAARRVVGDLVGRHAVREVVKAKSMTTEEIGLNEFLEAKGVRVVESDLGEWIVQLAGQKPYHIVTPAMHLNRAAIGRLFHDKLGTPLTATPEELTMIARAHLRQVYVQAGLGVTGANFLVADDGAAVMIENEGNGRLSMACPRVHVVVAGIEKVIPRLADLALFLPLLVTSGTGQRLSAYASLVRGPRQAGEADGPEELHVILLDNGRSALYAKPDFRVALRCLRCGACLNACPVYCNIGGHSYGTTYQGPIGSAITPHLRELARFQHLAQACTLCQACADVCPVDIPLPELLWRNRTAAHAANLDDFSWRAGLELWSRAVTSRRRLQLGRRLYALVAPGLHRLLPAAIRHKIPSLARRTFAQLWRDQERHHGP